MPRQFDVAALIDGQKLTGFNYRLIILSWFATVFDGFDMMMMSYTAPYVRDELGLAQSSLGTLFSAGVLGMVLGGFLFSWIGDRWGRRNTIVLAVFTFGLFTFATGFARSFEAFVALRLLAGLAIGGVLPLAWALNIEFVPRRIRATVVTLIMIGYSLGGALAGPLTQALAPAYGWPAVFFAGGVGTLVCGAALWLWLPESLRFLIVNGRRPDLVAKTLNRIFPNLGATADDRFVLSDEAPAARSGFRLADLFAGPLKLLTPLLWLGYFASSLAMFFVSSWGPILIESITGSRATAAYAGSVNSIVGVVAALALTRITDKRGPWGIVAYAAVAFPIALAIGLGDMGGMAFLILYGLGAGAAIGGAHFGIQSIAGIYYPSAIRAVGAGWASSIAKMGGVAGPLVGAAVLASGLPIRSAFTVLALCPLVLGLCAAGIGMVLTAQKRREALEPVAAG